MLSYNDFLIGKFTAQSIKVMFDIFIIILRSSYIINLIFMYLENSDLKKKRNKEYLWYN